MADLWSQDRSQRRAAAEPLARRMRPRSLDEFLGQEHIVGPADVRDIRRILDESLHRLDADGTRTLAQAAIYMATAEKSNASARAIWDARSDVRNERTVPVPKHLRDSSYPGAKALGHGEKYQYPHDPADGYVLQEYLGVDRVYYIPTDRGYEAAVKKRVDRRRPASDDD